MWSQVPTSSINSLVSFVNHEIICNQYNYINMEVMKPVPNTITEDWYKQNIKTAFSIEIKNIYMTTNRTKNVFGKTFVNLNLI